MQRMPEELAAARAEALARLVDLRRELAAIAESTAATPDDEHDAEGATVGFERARVGALEADARRALADIDAAVDRWRAGRYGRCVRCGQAIGDERLSALPSTPWCVECAAGPAGAMRRATPR